MVVPYSKRILVVIPCGSTIPLSVAEELVTFVASFARTIGGPVAFKV